MFQHGVGFAITISEEKKRVLEGYHCVNQYSTVLFSFKEEFSSRLASTAEEAARKSDAHIVYLKNQIATLKQGTGCSFIMAFSI